MEWFKEELLGGNHKALGVYLALLACRFHKFPTSYNFPKIMNRIEREILRRLRGRNFKEATNSARLFVEAIISKRMEDPNQITRGILDEIECKYYEMFKEAYLKTVKKDRIREVETVYTFLKSLAEGDLYSVLSLYTASHGRTKCGSIHFNFTVRSKAVDYLGLQSGIELEELFSILRDSNIFLSEFYIFPAPVLEKSFIEELIE